MENTSRIIGYVVKHRNTRQFVHEPDGRGFNFLSDVRPAPISKPDAYRRLAAYLDENPDVVDDNTFYVTAVFYEPTPIERAASELGNTLRALCSRHGLDLGMTAEQIDKQLVGELEAFKAGAASQLFTGIPKLR